MRAEEVLLPDARAFYGLPAEDGGPDLRANFEKFLAHLERRRDSARPVVVIIDGKETGVGKSSLAICLGRRLDKDLGLGSIVYSSSDLFRLYETRKPGAVAIYDEAVLGLLSKKGSRDEELAGLIQALSMVRKNGIITFILIPKIRMLDTIVYHGLAPHWIFCEDRGRGRVHRAHKGAHYRNSQARIPYDLWTAVSPLTWDNLDGDPFFEAYKEQAKERNRAQFAELQQIVAAKRARLLGGATRGPLPVPNENVPSRALESVCVCAECGYRWAPRNGSGGRCPKCGSYERQATRIPSVS